MMKECIRPRKGAGPRCYTESGENCGSFKEIRMKGGDVSCAFLGGIRMEERSGSYEF